MISHPTQPRASHFIGGAHVDDAAGKPLVEIYPTTGEVNANLHEATSANVDQATGLGQAKSNGMGTHVEHRT